MKRSALERSDHAWNDPEGDGHPFDRYFAVFEYICNVGLLRCVYDYI